MNFLAPLFLLGALAVAAPVIFHLIRRTTREKTRFSSLLFLQPDPPRLTQRSRIENWLLLLLRAAALALLALAFARPFIRTESSPDANPDENRRMVILLDTSASMRRPGLAEAAQAKAEEVLRGAKPGDQVSLWTFDSTVRRLIDFTEWTSLPCEIRAAVALGRLSDFKAGWSSTQLAPALTTAAEFLSEHAPGQPKPGNGEILLLSDLQEGSGIEGLQGWAWPQDVVVTPLVLAPKEPGNAGLHLAPDSTAVAMGEKPQARVRLWNAADSTGEQFQVGWAANGAEVLADGAQDVTVPPGQSRVVALAWPEGRKGTADASGRIENPRSMESRLLLKGDVSSFDNSVFAAPPSSVEVMAWYFGAESLTDSKKPLFFLKQALPSSPRVTVKLEPIPPGGPLPTVLPGQPAIFFAHGAIPDEQAQFLHGQLKAGRTALLTLTPDAAATLAGISGGQNMLLEAIKPSGYGMLSEINFQHPLFAPFADPRFSDFTKIRFWNYTKFAPAVLPDSRVLARFDSGDPALVEVPVGQGRLIVLASGWQPEASQLALSSKFVPLLASFLEWSGAVVTPPAQFFTGQPIALNLLRLTGVGPVSILHPDGTSTSMAPEMTTFTASAQPGLYTATAGTLTKTFAVNLDPSESRTAPLPADELERLGVPVKLAGPMNPDKSAKAANAPAIETESRQKLWRWIIAAAVAVLMMETLLAGLAARHHPIPGGPAL